MKYFNLLRYIKNYNFYIILIFSYIINKLKLLTLYSNIIALENLRKIL